MKRVVNSRSAESSYLSLTEGKTHLRVTDSDSDDEINNMIASAIDIVGDYLGFVINGSEVTYYTNDLINPIQYISITSVEYLSGKNTYSDIGPYDKVECGRNIEIIPKTSPDLYTYGYKYKIVVVQGYNSSDMPPRVKDAIKLVLHDLYEQRGDMLPVNLYKIPRGIESLLFNESWRIFV